MAVVAGAAAVAAITGCGGSESESERVAAGQRLFTTAFEGTNERSCASCHVPEDNFTLTPAHVAKVYAQNPKDPLFAAIDADDPTAKALTFDHLKKGLVRVWLTLPMKMDVIDDRGRVITPTDRRIWVWRAVPSIADVALTAPYQLDGREAALDTQAQGAVTSHSEGGTISASELGKIAAFERSLLSSDRVKSVLEKVAAGTAVADITGADRALALTAQERRGQEVFEATCAACHGGGATTSITDREVHATAGTAANADGTLSPFIDIGTGRENYMAQLSKQLGFRVTEHVAYTEGLSYPQYRFRFYQDDTQRKVIAERPKPLEAELPGDTPSQPPAAGGQQPGAEGPGAAVGGDQNPATDGGQLPAFTTDPGRAAITGDPRDFEAFDIPSLRGVSKTAPYWHNNISKDLRSAIDLYSDHLLAAFSSLTVNDAPPQRDADGDIGPIEALSEEQKVDLLAYLERL